PTANAREVEGVQRLAALEHHVVGDVDHVVDRAHAETLEPAAHPQRRRTDLHSTHDARHVTVAQSAVADLHTDTIGGGWSLLRQARLRHAQPGPGKRRHLAGDAENRQAIAAIGCDGHLEHAVRTPE